MNDEIHSDSTIVKLLSLQKIYRLGPEEVTVLQNVNLKVIRGTTVLVLGESGSGKSTLLNMIGGLDTPTRGTVDVEGASIGTMDERILSQYRNSVIGFIFQFHYLLKDFTALENVMMPALIAGRSSTIVRREAQNLLCEVGLKHRQKHYPSELSGGERQRAAVARALINSPSLILADEPTGNLDEKNAVVVLDLLFELVKKFKKTMIMVTHEHSIRKHATESYLLEHGELMLL
jgi:lipoprotein-releasing system ATP-binding protein